MAYKAIVWRRSQHMWCTMCIKYSWLGSMRAPPMVFCRYGNRFSGETIASRLSDLMQGWQIENILSRILDVPIHSDARSCSGRRGCLAETTMRAQRRQEIMHRIEIISPTSPFHRPDRLETKKATSIDGVFFWKTLTCHVSCAVVRQ